MDPRIWTAFVLVIVLIIVSSPIIPIEEEVTRYSTEYYSYEQKLVHEKQTAQIPWFWNKVTQVQYLVTNNDTQDGKFTLYYYFDNGKESDTQIKNIKILAHTGKIVTVNSRLTGTSNISLTVVPPYRLLPYQEKITRNVSAWHFLNPIKWIFR